MRDAALERGLAASRDGLGGYPRQGGNCAFVSHKGTVKSRFQGDEGACACFGVCLALPFWHEWGGVVNTVRVALAEDNVLLREGMSRLVAANEDFELAGVAGDL